MTADYTHETRPEGQQLCPLCWPDADPREYAVLLCTDHGAARAVRTDADAFLDANPAGVYFNTSPSEGDGVTGRLWAELLHRPYDARRK